MCKLNKALHVQQQQVFVTVLEKALELNAIQVRARSRSYLGKKQSEKFDYEGTKVMTALRGSRMTRNRKCCFEGKLMAREGNSIGGRARESE